MTVPVDSRRREHDGNGTTVASNGPPAYLASHVKVYLVSVSTGVATLQSAYTVTRLGISTGCRVTFTTAPASGFKVLILRVMPYEQAVDLTNVDRYLPETLERGYDLLGMQVQQLADIQARSLSAPETIIGGVFDYDALGHGIKNGSPATTPAGFVTLSQLTSLLAGGAIYRASFVTSGATTSSSAPGVGPNYGSATVAAGKSYSVRVMAVGYADLTGPYGFGVGVAGSAAGGVIGRAMVQKDSGVADPEISVLSSFASCIAYVYDASPANTKHVVDIAFTFRCTTSGTLEFVFGSTSGVGDSSTMMAGALFSVEEILNG